MIYGSLKTGHLPGPADRGTRRAKAGRETYDIPPEPAKPVDATGAGDLWQAGFLFGWLHHAEPEVCGRIGSILGAAAVSHFGARLPEDRWRDLRGRIRSLL